MNDLVQTFPLYVAGYTETIYYLCGVLCSVLRIPYGSYSMIRISEDKELVG